MKWDNSKGTFCECSEREEIIEMLVEALMNHNNNFIAFNVETEEDIKEMEEWDRWLKVFLDDTEGKIKKFQNELLVCQNKHKKIQISMENYISTIDRLRRRYLKKKEENRKKIDLLPKKKKSFSKTEEKYPSSYSNSDIANNQNAFNNINNYDDYNKNNNNDNEDVEGEDENESEWKKFKVVQTYLDSDDLKSKMNQEDLKAILVIKDQIKVLLNLNREKIKEADQQLLSIEDYVENSHKQVQKGNKELVKAAKTDIKSKKLKLTALYSTIFGIIGTVVPGVGNVIGAAVGAGVGWGVAKLNEMGLKKLEKKMSKEKSKK